MRKVVRFFLFIRRNAPRPHSGLALFLRKRTTAAAPANTPKNPRASHTPHPEPETSGRSELPSLPGSAESVAFPVLFSEVRTVISVDRSSSGARSFPGKKLTDSRPIPEFRSRATLRTEFPRNKLPIISMQRIKLKHRFISISPLKPLFIIIPRRKGLCQ